MTAAVSDRPAHARHNGQTTRIPITVGAKSDDGAHLTRTAEPISMGLPFPRSVCVDPQSLALVDAAGALCPLQVRVLDRWPDGSMRWALLDFQADAGGREPSRYDVVVSEAPADAVAGPRLTISPRGKGLTVDTGVARFALAPRGHFPFESVALDGSSVIDPARSGLFVEGARGESLTPAIERIELEEEGPN